MSDLKFKNQDLSPSDLSLLAHQDYVDLLQAYLNKRHGERGSMSLRSFAKLTGVSVSRLSLVLRRKGDLSMHGARKIAAAISESKIFFDYFLALVEMQTTKDSKLKQCNYQHCRNLRYRYLFKTMESQELRTYDWKHFAVQFLAARRQKKPSLADLASSLGLDIDEVSSVVDWLIHRGHLEMSPQGRYVSTNPLIKVESKGTSLPIRKFHRELIKKALDAMETVPTDRRFLRSAIFTLNREQYFQLCELVVNFVTACTDCSLSESSPHDEVYGLSVQIFPLAVR